MTILIDVRWYMIIALICISLITTMLSIFLCAYWLSICLLWRNVCLGLMPIFWLGCLFFCYLVVWAVRIFWKLFLCWSHHLQIFSVSLLVVLSFVYGFLCCAKTCKFWLIPICLFFLLFLLPWETDLRICCYDLHQCFAYVFFWEFYSILSYI